jgi:hypothetical protein
LKLLVNFLFLEIRCRQGSDYFTQSQKNVPEVLLYSRKPLRATLLLASFGSSTPYSSHVFDLEHETPPMPYKEPERHRKKPEINHTFKEEATNPPKIVSLVFSAAIVAAVPVLLGAVSLPLAHAAAIAAIRCVKLLIPPVALSRGQHESALECHGNRAFRSHALFRFYICGRDLVRQILCETYTFSAITAHWGRGYSRISEWEQGTVRSSGSTTGWPEVNVCLEQ